MNGTEGDGLQAESVVGRGEMHRDLSAELLPGAPVELRRPILVAGMVAGVVMMLFTMLCEAVVGRGFWSPLVLAAAGLLREQGVSQAPRVPFLLVPVLVGFAGHMLYSIGLGIPLVLWANGMDRAPVRLVVGAAYGLALFAAMWLLVVPRMDPPLLHLNGFVFAGAHLVWGATAAWVAGSRALRGANGAGSGPDAS